jgi:hypothetical protein
MDGLKRFLKSLMMSAGLVFCAILLPVLAHADAPSIVDSATLYRDLSLKVRQQGSFRVPMPSNGDLSFSYQLKFGNARFAQPLINDFLLDAGATKFIRNFWDKIFLQDGSVLNVGGESVPLTCVFVRGQDNRFSQKDTPLIPDFVLRVYLVANDYTCTGPINPGWPTNGQRKETWDTYVYFEVRDPTIMLPTEAKIRYRWTELPAFVVSQ